MKYTVEYTVLVNNNYITLNVGDVITGMALYRPAELVVNRINKTGRDF